MPATGTPCSCLSNKNPHPLRRWGFSPRRTQLLGLVNMEHNWQGRHSTTVSKKQEVFCGLGCDYHVGGLNEMIPVLPASGPPERPSVGLGFGLGCEKSRRRGQAADRPEKILRPNRKKGRGGYVKRYVKSLCKAICKHPEIYISTPPEICKAPPPERRRAYVIRPSRAPLYVIPRRSDDIQGNEQAADLHRPAQAAADPAPLRA